ncbi:MAG: alpha-glucan family phosphorylase [Armatimonadetes bacterium]|nr:alpha-glucan family phosphorylase [Armatimonadota bacterium]MDE2206583.1 alpha-glucan family phosphorylase [Armatimonadota bacterium]
MAARESTENSAWMALRDLALDMRWSWNHASDRVWCRLDPELWEFTRNPWAVLQTVSPRRCDELWQDVDFRSEVDGLLRQRRAAMATPVWFQQQHPEAELTAAAYFSMEYMLSEALPLYCGGLGNVAGDHLKAASDLGVPLVAVGLLYQQGYFRQVIGPDGGQDAVWPYLEPGQLPVTPVRNQDGEWIRIQLEMPGRPLTLRTWEVQVGRVRLFLLDSNDPANYPAQRDITSQLYGGGSELRLQQELALGIGGWRLLREIGIAPEVCHLNEGHAAFAVLERTRGLMADSNQPFHVAFTAARPGNLFTTHTALDAAFDRFAPEMVCRYLGDYANKWLGIDAEQLLALGRSGGSDGSEYFNMAWLALRGCGAVNGVSRLHGEASRAIFQPLFPRWPRAEVPVGHVTNGVHMASWDSAEADALWTEACTKERWRGDPSSLPHDIGQVSDERLWRYRTDASTALVANVRERVARDRAASGAGADEVDAARRLFNADVLTLGFARRFAEYKRPNMLLHDRERLRRLLCDPQRPAQLLIAGKAHPQDYEGQAMIQDWVGFLRQAGVRDHAAFLADYDMLLTEQLVQGVDVWINTPRRPWEACGTSGMKTLVNGGINVSELDGWWAEAYDPSVGWALGDGAEHGGDAEWDALEAEELYSLLEREVIPEFYDRDASGIPRRWVQRMRASMASLTPRFAASRSVREYTESYYIPAAAAFKERTADGCRAAHGIASWQRRTLHDWQSLKFSHLDQRTYDGRHHFELTVDFGRLRADEIRLELYADAVPGGRPERIPMTPGSQPSGTLAVYCADVAAERPSADYTVRALPVCDGAAIPLENPCILWEH